MRVGQPLAAMLLGIGLAATSACGSGTADVASEEAGSRADVDYMFSSLGRTFGYVRDPFGPTSLAEAVPRPRGPLDERGATPASSELMVAGTVVDVSKGEARRHTTEDDYEVVEFDDPEAQERTALVTVAVDLAVAPSGPKSVDTQTFRVGLSGADDPGRFLAGLRGMDRVVVLLAEVRDGRDQGTLYPIMAGAAIGEVSSDGALSFPAMGDDAAGFMGRTNRIEELERLATSTSLEGIRQRKN